MSSLKTKPASPVFLSNFCLFAASSQELLYGCPGLFCARFTSPASGGYLRFNHRVFSVLQTLTRVLHFNVTNSPNGTTRGNKAQHTCVCRTGALVGRET